MSTSFVCTRCRRALEVSLFRCSRSGPSLRTQRLHQRPQETVRWLSSTPSSCAAQPQPYQTTESKSSGEAASPSASQASQFSPARSIAKELRKRASVSTETYIAYGVCENLVKECARQADYKIPQRQEKNVDIPKSQDGEDLGVGEGWWYHGMDMQKCLCCAIAHL